MVRRGCDCVGVLVGKEYDSACEWCDRRGAHVTPSFFINIHVVLKKMPYEYPKHPPYRPPPIEVHENLKLHRERSAFIHKKQDNRVWKLSRCLAMASESLHHKLERYHADRWEVFRHHLDGHSEQVLEYAQSLIDILRKKE